MRFWFALSIAAEVVARLALFGALFALFAADDPKTTAARIGVIATVAAFARPWLRAELLRLHVERLYAAIARAVAKKSVTELAANRSRSRMSDLLNAAFDVAGTQSQAAPDLLAASLSIVVLLVALGLRHGWAIPFLGIAGAAFVAAVMTPARIMSRKAREKGWDAHVSAETSLDLLVFAAVELRGSARSGSVHEAFAREAAGLARAERTGARLGAAVSSVPALLTLGLIALPSSWAGVLGASKLGELGVFAAAGVTLTFSAVGALENLVRSAPVRRALDDFAGTPRTWLLFPAAVPIPSASAAPSEPRRLELRGVSVRYEGESRRTPGDLTFAAERGNGVALVGPNGTGKTTALLAALGLVELDAGQILVDDEPVEESARWEQLRASALIIPQRPHFVPDRSIAWHLATYGTARLTPAVCANALRKVGLLERLAARAKRLGVEPEDLPMGELSGGERQRVAFARALTDNAKVLLFDELEAGLDADARTTARGLLEELAADRVVIVVAHDPTIVPTGFRRVVVEAANVSDSKSNS